MPAYDEVLAQQILLALQEVFPNRLASHDLKRRPPFVEVPEDQWMLALDADMPDVLRVLWRLNGRDRFGEFDSHDAVMCFGPCFAPTPRHPR